MISRDDLITEALYTVGAQSLSNDFIRNESDRTNMYSIYETAVRTITDLCKVPLLIKEEEAVNNPALDDGWYFMPYDFVSWYSKISPALAYDVDKDYKYSVRLISPNIKYYAYYQHLTGLDSLFKQAIKWQFLSELKTVDSSIMQYMPSIEKDRMENIQRLRTKTKYNNIYAGR